MTKTFVAMGASALVALCIVGCSSNPEPKTEAKKDTLHDNAVAALNQMQREDPSLRSLLDRSAGYAIFPDVGKGGFIAGGSYGRGEVYQNGRFIGYADIKQATVGAQVGGETFSQLIVFENQNALDKFTRGQWAPAANASAVALKAGAAGSTNFKDGVAVFSRPQGGLMLEAAIGGQKYDFSPANNSSLDTRSDVRSASDRSEPAHRYERTETTTEHNNNNVNHSTDTTTDHSTHGVRGEVEVNPNR